VRISVTLIMQRKVRTHALRDKVLLHVLPNECDPVLCGDLFRNGNFNLACQLRVFLTLDFLHGVPKYFPVCVLCWRIFAKYHLVMKDTLFS
jgi:hypothetical protein